MYGRMAAVAGAALVALAGCGGTTDTPTTRPAARQTTSAAVEPVEPAAFVSAAAHLQLGTADLSTSPTDLVAGLGNSVCDVLAKAGTTQLPTGVPLSLAVQSLESSSLSPTAAEAEQFVLLARAHFCPDARL